MNPNYTYKLWTDADNRALVAQQYPWFLATYDGFDDPIMRADASRLFYMHQYGGVYADLDFECLKPLDPLLKSHAAVLGSMTTGSSFFMRVHALPNAFMASRPGHPFWLSCARRIMRGRNQMWGGTVEQRTGPVMLYRCLKGYQRTSGWSVDPVWVTPKVYLSFLVVRDDDT
ncbi:nucleotide-diphospho-sugar transferase [Chytriomyces sp. MP71]|nr:nucleotide-diphospho-sugar transferase [Chytriomyces sp. MP71]